MERNSFAIITGGTSGLGNALARVFLNEGWSVATCGRRSAPLEDLANEFGEEKLLAATCDIRLDNHVSSFVERAAGKFGKADVVILNAGEIGPLPLPEVESLSLMDLRKTMETNLFGNFNFLHYALPVMKERSLVIHITSDAAAENYPGWGAYSSSKAAMDKIISVLNAEKEGTGLSAFSFDPGDMNTAMHALAVPDSPPEQLKDPFESAMELFRKVEGHFGKRVE